MSAAGISVPGPRMSAASRRCSPQLAEIHADRVGEEHQDQAQGGDHLERRRVERQVDQAEPGGPEHHAEQEEDGDLRQPGALDRAGEERRDQDDEADQGERRR